MGLCPGASPEEGNFYGAFVGLYPSAFPEQENFYAAFVGLYPDVSPTEENFHGAYAELYPATLNGPRVCMEVAGVEESAHILEPPKKRRRAGKLQMTLGFKPDAKSKLGILGLKRANEDEMRKDDGHSCVSLKKFKAHHSSDEGISSSVSSQAFMPKVLAPKFQGKGKHLNGVESANPTASRKGKGGPNPERRRERMMAKYDGKMRMCVFAECQNDASVIKLKLVAAEKAKVKNRCKCLICGVVFNQESKAVVKHLMSTHHTEAENVQGEVQQLGLHLQYGGEAHRKGSVDSYMLAYLSLKEKLAFTTPEKLKKVMRHMHCTDPRQVDHIYLSARTVARYTINLYCILNWPTYFYSF